MPADVVKRMKREAAVMCTLNHPNVLHILGVVPDHGCATLALVGGCLLQERGGPVALAQLSRNVNEALPRPGSQVDRDGALRGRHAQGATDG